VSETSLIARGMAPPGWVCVQCRARNAMGADVCSACRRPFAAGLIAPPTRAPIDLAAPIGAARELILVVGLFLGWRLVGALGDRQPAAAIANGQWLWRVERALHLPSELAVQRAFLPHHLLIELLNGFYIVAHVGSMLVFLGWLYLRHRDRYRRWRAAVIAFTGACLLIQLVPVAPPRLVGGLGLVDTGRLYHQSVYGAAANRWTDQFASLPSVHVGWAILIAVAVITVSRSRWRWLVLAQPALTGLAVIVTANHFWLDGLLAGLLVAAVLGVQRWRLGHPGGHPAATA